MHQSSITPHTPWRSSRDQDTTTPLSHQIERFIGEVDESSHGSKLLPAPATTKIISMAHRCEDRKESDSVTRTKRITLIFPKSRRSGLMSTEPQDVPVNLEENDSFKGTKRLAPSPGKAMAPLDFVENIFHTSSALPNPKISLESSSPMFEEELELNRKEMTEKAEILSMTNMQPFFAAIYREKVRSL